MAAAVVAGHRETDGDSLSQGSSSDSAGQPCGTGLPVLPFCYNNGSVTTGKQKGHSVKALNVMIDDELKDEVVAYAKAWHISQAAAVKILLRTGLLGAPRPGRDENRREPGP